VGESYVACVVDDYVSLIPSATLTRQRRFVLCNTIACTYIYYIITSQSRENERNVESACFGAAAIHNVADHAARREEKG